MSSQRVREMEMVREMEIVREIGSKRHVKKDSTFFPH
jgi:hypothetical protein